MVDDQVQEYTVSRMLQLKREHERLVCSQTMTPLGPSFKLGLVSEMRVAVESVQEIFTRTGGLIWSGAPAYSQEGQCAMAVLGEVIERARDPRLASIWKQLQEAREKAHSQALDKPTAWDYAASTFEGEEAAHKQVAAILNTLRLEVKAIEADRG
ncbi:hypothetical protein E1295_37675 [Nonomuraea mesophila]|uniref:Uncharacterized protein n=1 Tax=Nonomuraea mesophila TaxID=2530382 RepID=A0A4R5EHD3_9ACTN|nr:hypothetical protein [Nonomuraea mesophila]TDE33901.1 hypothetical protein E1295_37675 [Nonomuraea mesophila]